KAFEGDQLGNPLAALVFRDLGAVDPGQSHQLFLGEPDFFADPSQVRVKTVLIGHAGMFGRRNVPYHRNYGVSQNVYSEFAAGWAVGAARGAAGLSASRARPRPSPAAAAAAAPRASSAGPGGGRRPRPDPD